MYEDDPLHELDRGKFDAGVRGRRYNKVKDARLGLTEDVPVLAVCAVGAS